MLQTRADELRHSLSETELEGRITQQLYGADEGDRANSSQEKELSFQRSTYVRNLLANVEGALRRIGEGTFGECINCGQEIGTKRLHALPWTRYCITCQELIEESKG